MTKICNSNRRWHRDVVKHRARRRLFTADPETHFAAAQDCTARMNKEPPLTSAGGYKSADREAFFEQIVAAEGGCHVVTFRSSAAAAQHQGPGPGVLTAADGGVGLANPSAVTVMRFASRPLALARSRKLMVK